MATQSITQILRAEEFTFPNGKHAKYVVPSRGTPARDILSALDIPQPKMLILIIGGAGSLDKRDEGTKSRLVQLFSRGIARAAAMTGSLIIDGGTKSGVMEMIGRGVADRGYQSPLLGVAPAGKVSYPGGAAVATEPDCAPLDPNHTHFVLVPGTDWGDETETMFELAQAVAGKFFEAMPLADGTSVRASDSNRTKSRIPVVTILVGGGIQGVAKSEVLHSVREGWQIIVIEGSGDLADEIIKQVKQPPESILDPDLAEIIADGNLRIFSQDNSVPMLQQLILLQLSENHTLKLAWDHFAKYDENAKRHQRDFNNAEKLILGLGILTTLLALLQTTSKNPDLPKALSILLGTTVTLPPVDLPFHLSIIILPILTSILLAALNRVNPASKWVLLRGSAEAIKREIFRYRARPALQTGEAGDQSDPNKQGAAPAAERGQAAAQLSREARLAERLGFITHQLMQSNVNLSALRPYNGSIPPAGAAPTGDDGLSPLTPDQYIATRLDDQLNYFQAKTVTLERNYRWLQWAILVIGGVGTFLAAVNLELWVALTTALVTAITTYLGYQQTENSLIQYNQTAANLESMKGWWYGLSAEDQADPGKVANLVETTEKILESELTGWVQQMHDALAELHAQQEGKEAQRSEGAEGELSE